MTPRRNWDSPTPSLASDSSDPSLAFEGSVGVAHRANVFNRLGQHIRVHPSLHLVNNHIEGEIEHWPQKNCWKFKGRLCLMYSVHQLFRTEQ